MKIFAAGSVKRIFIDRDAAARHLPSWIVEDENGCRWHFRSGHVYGVVRLVDGHKPDITSGPAYWIQTQDVVYGFTHGDLLDAANNGRNPERSDSTS